MKSITEIPSAVFSPLFLCICFLMSYPVIAEKQPTSAVNPIAIAIHGGAGTIVKSKLCPQLEKAYRAKLREALEAGYAVLQNGKSSVEAVQKTIVIMEDSPLFNAGKGAVFTHDGVNELDASIMEGRHLNAGAVSGVSTVKNPIKLAIEVMRHSRHVMLSGSGAVAFAKKRLLDIEKPEYFKTERRWKQLRRNIKEDPDKTTLSEDKSDKQANVFDVWPDEHKFGTVGAVALDRNGDLAAGTSTGGMSNKKFGRIGDSPIIGAGTYADNKACAVSATGHGEYFIRAAVAHDICARVLYGKVPLQQAADDVIQDKLVSMGGRGGVVTMGPSGKPLFSFNSEGMYRGYIDSKGKVYIAIFKDH